MAEKTFPDLQQEKINKVNFGDRLILLELIEYTRNSSSGYGITDILENFLNMKLNAEIKKLSQDSESISKAIEAVKRMGDTLSKCSLDA